MFNIPVDAETDLSLNKLLSVYVIYMAEMFLSLAEAVPLV
jgi:hypothetical protein